MILDFLLKMKQVDSYKVNPTHPFNAWYYKCIDAKKTNQ